MSREQERISLGQTMAATLLVLVGLLLFFYHLGATDLDERTPARIAVYAERMNTDGVWLAPTLREQARVDVPPLYLWATRILSGFSTKINAFQERTPAALSAIALVLLVAWWLYRHAGRYSREDLAEASPEGFALMAGLILASNPVLFSVGRDGSLHTMFVLCYVAAALCFGESMEARRSFYAGRPWRSWVLWGYFFAGVAMLVRGPLVLPLLWVPYWLAARSYQLRRIDWSHGVGLLLALAIGASWPLLIGIIHPAAAPGLWREWLSLHIGNLDAIDTPFYEYLWHILASSFPWNLLALVLAFRVWRRTDRSPTLVFWMSSLVGNILVLTFLSAYVGQHRLPVIVFISLLAADAIYRWNFESPWAVAWRVLLRILIVAGIIVSIVGSLLLKSDLGVVLFILVPIAWIVWAVRSRLGGVIYTPWETSVRLGAMLVCVLVAAEAVLLAEYEPKRAIYSDRLAYFSRILDRIEDSDEENGSEAAIVFQNAEQDILYDYYLGVQPALARPVSTLKARPDQPLYFLADSDAKQYLGEPNLDAMTFLWNNSHTQPREGMFRVRTRLVDTQTTAAATAAPSAEGAPTTVTAVQPWRVALLGNHGTRRRDQQRVGLRLNSYASRHPVEDVLLLGNNLYGNSVFDHLDFVDAFERPYHRLLQRGVTFHAALGHEDQSWAWAQLQYPPFNMNHRRYYTFTTGPGTIDVFMLDGERLYADKQFDEAQLKWLEEALAASRARWKIVGLSQPLASAAQGANVRPELGARLLPMFDQYKVNLVAWAGGTWYERLELPGHFPVFINAGWSGLNRDTGFNADPRLKFGYDDRPGFVVLEFTPDRMTIRASNDKGKVIDHVEVAPAGGPARSLQPPAPPLGPRTSSPATTSTTAPPAPVNPQATIRNPQSSSQP